jgi:hypothetical protein
MLNWLSNILPSRSLGSVLGETKTVRINGIRFKIKKIDAMAFLDGSKVMLQMFDTYNIKQDSPKEVSNKKIREHMKEMLIAGVAEPKLAYKAEDGYLVDDLFVNLKLVNQLYSEVIQFTYGKKKIQNS